MTSALETTADDGGDHLFQYCKRHQKKILEVTVRHKLKGRDKVCRAVPSSTGRRFPGDTECKIIKNQTYCFLDFIVILVCFPAIALLKAHTILRRHKPRPYNYFINH